MPGGVARQLKPNIQQSANCLIERAQAGKRVEIYQQVSLKCREVLLPTSARESLHADKGAVCILNRKMHETEIGGGNRGSFEVHSGDGKIRLHHAGP